MESFVVEREGPGWHPGGVESGARMPSGSVGDGGRHAV
jgi:hypothetical protein